MTIFELGVQTLLLNMRKWIFLKYKLASLLIFFWLINSENDLSLYNIKIYSGVLLIFNRVIYIQLNLKGEIQRIKVSSVQIFQSHNLDRKYEHFQSEVTVLRYRCSTTFCFGTLVVLNLFQPFGVNNYFRYLDSVCGRYFCYYLKFVILSSNGENNSRI